MTTANAGAAATYLEHRDLLMGIAYRLLGRVADAEDVVQEAWLRWSGVEQAQVENPRAFLVRVTTRLALDRLRRIKARRETYIGEWLPEPVLTAETPDPSEHLELTESVSLAMLVVLETLSPLERAVFVLNEAFAIPYAELARMLGRSEVAVRQVASRSRRHVEERRPRFDRDPAARRRVTERFLAAAANGDVTALLEVLSPGVTLVADGGGVMRAPLRPILGAEKVLRFLAAIQAREGFSPDDFHPVTVNGGPGMIVDQADGHASLITWDVRDGAVERIYLVSNPGKLAGLRVSPLH
jgi:RNA polymerase sigma-70 factor (ECF subfamily)